MAPGDISQILAAIQLVATEVSSVSERLARIEERTGVLADHEARIRAAEEAARVAGETAVQAKATAEAQAVRIRTLEDNDRSAGKFTIGALGRFGATVLLAAASTATVITVFHPGH